VQVAVGVVGGSFMIFMGIQAFRNRQQQQENVKPMRRESLIAGIWTTAANAGFILWWLTIGTALILNAQIFGLTGFAIFTGVHWSVDFLWYSIVGFVIFKSQRFWSNRIRLEIALFCAAIFIGFGAYFVGSALWSMFV
jgi:threonine/homoserine/homoserine lactone efflux protein